VLPTICQRQQFRRAAPVPALLEEAPDGLADAGQSIEQDHAQRAQSLLLPWRNPNPGPEDLDVFA